eukprot:evm.model.NODE_48224_length_24899_cov_27.292582.2
MQQQQGKSSDSMDIGGAPVAQIMEDVPAVSSKEVEANTGALNDGGGSGGRAKREGGEVGKEGSGGGLGSSGCL